MIFTNFTPYIIAGGGVLAIVLFVAIFFIVRARYKNKPEPKKIDTDEWVNALGGASNIKEVYIKGSRLSVELVDKENINREALTNLGVKSIISMSNKLILVIEEDGEKIVDQINSQISK